MNPDLIQRIDSAPDTILTLIDGTKYIVAESIDEVIDRIHEHRAQILARAQRDPGAAPRSWCRTSVRGRRRPTADADEPLAPAVPLRPRSR